MAAREKRCEFCDARVSSEDLNVEALRKTGETPAPQNRHSNFNWP
jgi:hypothetical protein